MFECKSVYRQAWTKEERYGHCVENSRSSVFKFENWRLKLYASSAQCRRNMSLDFSNWILEVWSHLFVQLKLSHSQHKITMDKTLCRIQDERICQGGAMRRDHI